MIFYSGAKLSHLATLAQGGGTPRRVGEVMRGTLEYKGRTRHMWLRGRTLTIAKSKADTEEAAEVLIAFNVAGASVERDDVFLELELVADAELHLCAIMFLLFFFHRNAKNRTCHSPLATNVIFDD